MRDCTFLHWVAAVACLLGSTTSCGPDPADTGDGGVSDDTESVPVAFVDYGSLQDAVLFEDDTGLHALWLMQLFNPPCTDYVWDSSTSVDGGISWSEKSRLLARSQCVSEGGTDTGEVHRQLLVAGRAYDGLHAMDYSFNMVRDQPGAAWQGAHLPTGPPTSVVVDSADTMHVLGADGDFLSYGTQSATGPLAQVVDRLQGFRDGRLALFEDRPIAIADTFITPAGSWGIRRLWATSAIMSGWADKVDIGAAAAFQAAAGRWPMARGAWPTVFDPLTFRALEHGGMLHVVWTYADTRGSGVIWSGWDGSAWTSQTVDISFTPAGLLRARAYALEPDPSSDYVYLFIDQAPGFNLGTDVSIVRIGPDGPSRPVPSAELGDFADLTQLGDDSFLITSWPELMLLYEWDGTMRFLRGDITDAVDFDPPEILSAVATSPISVLVALTRPVDAASLASEACSIDGLDIVDVQSTPFDTSVVVTTSEQIPESSYEVLCDGLTADSGLPIEASSTFSGFDVAEIPQIPMQTTYEEECLLIPHKYAALGADNRIWMAARGGIVRLDPDRVFEHPLPFPNPSYDPFGYGNVIDAPQNTIVDVDSVGGVWFSAPEEGIGVGIVEAGELRTISPTPPSWPVGTSLLLDASPDGSGAWIISGRELVRVNADGTTISTPLEDAEVGTIVDLADDGTRLWVASNLIGSDAEVIHPGGPAYWDGATWTYLPKPEGRLIGAGNWRQVEVDAEGVPWFLALESLGDGGRAVVLKYDDGWSAWELDAYMSFTHLRITPLGGITVSGPTVREFVDGEFVAVPTDQSRPAFRDAQGILWIGRTNDPNGGGFALELCRLR